MKNTLKALLLILSIFALAACGEDTTTTDVDTGTTTGTDVVTDDTLQIVE